MKAPPLPGEAVLTDVVAVSGRDSWAVGYHRHDGRAEALVLRWDGKQWRTAEAPVFDSNDVLLTAVSADPAGGVWVVGAAWDDAAKSHEAVAAWWDGQAWNEVAGRAGGTELHDVIGSLDQDGWAVGDRASRREPRGSARPHSRASSVVPFPKANASRCRTPGLTASGAGSAVQASSSDGSPPTTTAQAAAAAPLTSATLTTERSRIDPGDLR